MSIERFGNKLRPMPHAKTRARHLCHHLRLPNLFKVYKRDLGDDGKLRGVIALKSYVKKLAVIEQQLTEWEAANPEKHKELPWYEAREEYKRLKAEGNAPTVEWWQIAGTLDYLAAGCRVGTMTSVKRMEAASRRSRSARKPKG